MSNQSELVCESLFSQLATCVCCFTCLSSLVVGQDCGTNTISKFVRFTLINFEEDSGVIVYGRSQTIFVHLLWSSNTVAFEVRVNNNSNGIFVTRASFLIFCELLSSMLVLSQVLSPHCQRQPLCLATEFREIPLDVVGLGSFVHKSASSSGMHVNSGVLNPCFCAGPADNVPSSNICQVCISSLQPFPFGIDNDGKG